MGSIYGENELRSALALDIPYGGRRIGASQRASAVLVLFGVSESGRQSVLITRRTESVEKHKGQMAFPGGAADEGDADLISTALRETQEEVGIAQSDVDVLGELPVMDTPTGFTITPVVGLLKPPIEKVELKLSAAEIAETLWVPVEVLLAQGTYRQESMKFGAVSFPIHVYQVGPHRIWGATGAMLKNLLDRLAALR